MSKPHPDRVPALDGLRAISILFVMLAHLAGTKNMPIAPNVAIVIGIASETGATPEGKRFKSSRRFTDKWVSRNGRWQCVASKVARLSQQ